MAKSKTKKRKNSDYKQTAITATEEKTPEKKSIASVKDGECIGCNAFVNQCPEEGIPPVEESEGKLEEEKCIGCGACVDVCPVDAIEMKEV